MSKQQQPLFTVGAFGILADGARVAGSPPVEQWAVALCAVARARDGAAWAIGDMLIFGEKYEDDPYEEACDNTGLKRGTLMNMKSLAKTFPKPHRVSGLSWSHHALVAGFDEETRIALLLRAKTERLSYEELRGIVRGVNEEARFQAQTWPEGTFGLILADPPWPYEAGAVDPSRQIENQYPPMTIADISSLGDRIATVRAPDCILYLWATSAMMVSGEAVEVVKAWGFNGRSTMVWVKESIGGGYWARQRHEHLLIATHGSPMPPAEHMRPDSVIEAPRREHSQKPALVHTLLEACYPRAPKLELFARETREGWTPWGNERLGLAAPSRGMRVREMEALA